MTAHYGTTFTEKFASYLIVKDITDSLYNKTFMDALDASGVVYKQALQSEGSVASYTTDQKQKTKDYLDKLIKEIEADMS